MNNAMSWNRLLSSTRLGEKERKDTRDDRSPFEKDFDRIAFCSSFRRLGKKTQVHPLPHNDHVHTRLTHSIEVACVGRSLGLLCGKKIQRREAGSFCADTIHDISQIVQAACLAHDIGNPPFGHAGEKAIGAWFSLPESAYLLDGLTEDQKDDFRHFDGNAQSFRILTTLEHSYDGGMRLTCATLAALLKYPWTTLDIKRKDKYCILQSELNKFDDVLKGVGLVEVEEKKYCRHPLAYLVEAADDLCYRILDLEDACEMKILDFDEILDTLSQLCEEDKEFNSITKDKSIPIRKRMAHIRAKAIGYSIAPLASTFDALYDKIINGTLPCDTELISETESIKDALDKAKSLTRDKVFLERRKVALEIGAYSVISTLLDAFCRAVRERVLTKEETALSFKSTRVLDLLGNTAPKYDDDIYTAYLRATDYVSGMTDNYAKSIAKQITSLS